MGKGRGKDKKSKKNIKVISPNARAQASAKFEPVELAVGPDFLTLSHALIPENQNGMVANVACFSMLRTQAGVRRALS